MSNLLLLVVLCLGLLLWRGMARLRVPIDGFILALVFVLLAATLLPCQGEGARWLGLLGKCAVGALFFLQGARLSGQTVLNGVTHWRLHLFVGAATFLVFPLFGLGMLAVFPYLLPNSLWLGVLFVCALPSTVQSSIALTSMARGNVSAAICAATLSNVIGVALTPLLFGAMSHLHGRGVDAGAVAQVGMQLLLPFLAGHLLRPWLGAWAERNRKLLSITDRGSILLIVYTAFSAAVLSGIWQSLPPGTLAVLGLVMAGMLASVLATIVSTGRALGFDRARTRSRCCSADRRNPWSAACRLQMPWRLARSSGRCCYQSCCITRCNCWSAPGSPNSTSAPGNGQSEPWRPGVRRRRSFLGAAALGGKADPGPTPSGAFDAFFVLWNGRRGRCGPSYLPDP